MISVVRLLGFSSLMVSQTVFAGSFFFAFNFGAPVHAVRVMPPMCGAPRCAVPVAPVCNAPTCSVPVEPVCTAPTCSVPIVAQPVHVVAPVCFDGGCFRGRMVYRARVRGNACYGCSRVRIRVRARNVGWMY